MCDTNWTEALEWSGFTLSIKLGNEAMQTRDDVAKALRHAADSLQAGLSDEGRIHDDNGNGVGHWAFKDDPAKLDGGAVEYQAVLTIYPDDPANGDECDELAREVCQFVAEPVAFGCSVNVGGENAPPALKLPAIHGYQGGAL